jgi:hypothetical protein
MKTTSIGLQFDPITHISYSVTYKDLIGTWIELYHRDDYIVVLYDPVNHTEFLRSSDIDVVDTDVFESKILTVQVSSIEDGFRLLRNIPHNVGPYAQLWALGSYITDNIEK